MPAPKRNFENSHPPTAAELCKQRVNVRAIMGAVASRVAFHYARQHLVLVLALTNPIAAAVGIVAATGAYFAALAVLSIWRRNSLDQCNKDLEYSPLVLDLDGDGVEADGITYFDHEGDGWNVSVYAPA